MKSEFESVFGFPRPKRDAEEHSVDLGKVYGCAAYVKWDKRVLWFYEVGGFDYVWGAFCQFRTGDETRALALYVLDSLESRKPIEIISELRFTPEDQRRFGVISNHMTWKTSLIIAPSNLNKLPPVEF